MERTAMEQIPAPVSLKPRSSRSRERGLSPKLQVLA